MAADAIHAAIIVAKILNEAYHYDQECQELGTKCRTVQMIIETHKESFRDDPGVTRLS